MALAARLDGSSARAYTMLGDGEIQEGQIWEAVMFAACHKIDNVVAIVDYNKIQLEGFGAVLPRLRDENCAYPIEK